MDRKFAELAALTAGPGLQICRYAVKANPARPVLETARRHGLWIDAVSGNEVLRAKAAGFPMGHEPPVVMYTADVFREQRPAGRAGGRHPAERRLAGDDSRAGVRQATGARSPCASIPGSGTGTCRRAIRAGPLRSTASGTKTTSRRSGWRTRRASRW
ncbi:hypothetical protein [Tepidiforma flava]|uniref:hypothetical protein n=1 Tax=Tepidiforma flava TaxID=3004094 RepID=UPI003570A80D